MFPYRRQVNWLMTGGSQPPQEDLEYWLDGSQSSGLALLWNYVAVQASAWRSVTVIPSGDYAGRLVAVASAGTNQVMYSDDGGESWNYVAVQASAWYSVTAINSGDYAGRLVAVADSGTDRVMYSDDGGESWNYVVVQENRWRLVTVIPSGDYAGRLVAVADNGTNRVMYSDDGGESWNYVAVQDSAWVSVTAINSGDYAGRLVAVASAGTNQVMYSPTEDFVLLNKVNPSQYAIHNTANDTYNLNPTGDATLTALGLTNEYLTRTQIENMHTATQLFTTLNTYVFLRVLAYSVAQTGADQVKTLNYVGRTV